MLSCDFMGGGQCVVRFIPVLLMLFENKKWGTSMVDIPLGLFVTHLFFLWLHSGVIDVGGVCARQSAAFCTRAGLA